MTVCPKEKCTSCNACINICPHGAIKRSKDELHKVFAEINTEKCTNCGLCHKICPSNNPPQLKSNLSCYAAWSKNATRARECASGGLATEFSSFVVENGGAVFGTLYGENDFAFSSSDETSFENFKGSKYVQVNTGDIYKSVKAALKDGRKALFVGTPCQVAGLNAFLQRDYDNLITIDIICHGTPPSDYLKEYVSSVTNSKVDNITFRGKDDFYLTAWKNGEKLYSAPANSDYYFTAFLQSLTYADNCYSCQYARPERVGDITIGDFWGLDKNSLKEKHNGRISLLAINSKKGEEFFESTKDRFTYEKRDYSEAVKHNGQLSHPSIPHPDRAAFESGYKKYGFIKAVKTKDIKKSVRRYVFSKTLLYRVIRKFKNLMKG